MSKDLLSFVKKIEQSQLKTFYKKFCDARFNNVAQLLEQAEIIWLNILDTTDFQSAKLYVCLIVEEIER